MTPHTPYQGPRKYEVNCPLSNLWTKTGKGHQTTIDVLVVFEIHLRKYDSHTN